MSIIAITINIRVMRIINYSFLSEFEILGVRSRERLCYDNQVQYRIFFTGDVSYNHVKCAVLTISGSQTSKNLLCLVMSSPILAYEKICSDPANR